ncbi:WD40 repeat-containing protein [Belliella baltica DSM 15883]|uniref:WD40 repeat-containing protein n=1 Tax=Belliella baltica (strain DSM 15883 / CIP 108006 / LMG 21964 / BA134) TaxID=866536 RepID=I3Z5Y2_BELBD|nr:WD40 repeat domain-containing protein [Belliella baltica]AFL84650.1 WD40 repeat-containing protein [Belliella baltica DSM 15883]
MSKIQVNKLHTLTGHNDCIYALAEGSDPRFFYTGSGDGMVVEWDLDNPKDGKLIAKLPHSVYAITVDKERNLLFIGHNFEGIHVIDLNKNKEVWSLKITDQSIFDLKIVGRILFVATGDGVLTVIDIEEKSLVKHIKLSSKSARVMAVDNDQKNIAIGFSDHSIKVIDTADFKPSQLLEGHTNSVFALAYSPLHDTLVSGGRDASLKFWNTKTYKQTNNVIAHMFAINYLSFREDGKYFITCSMDKSIKIWDSEDHKLLKVIDKARHAGHGTSINKVLWSTYNQSIISVSDDRSISIWEVDI